MNYDVEVCHLSQDFYNAYPESKYPEIMVKDNRPYTCLLIETHDDYLICIPFRSHIPHKNAFIFKNTKRSNRTRSGLDYSKIALIKNKKYLDEKSIATVDNDEYTETISNINFIVNDINTYINKYKNHINGIKILSDRDYFYKYNFSTLPYFHDILDLPD